MYILLVILACYCNVMTIRFLIIFLLKIKNKGRYKCIEGYKIEGESNDVTEANIRCVGNDSYAEWNGPRPNCERKFWVYFLLSFEMGK